MSRRHIVRVAIVGLVAIALTAATAIGSAGVGRGKRGRSFTLAGHVSGLLPGVRRQLVITARNRGRRPLQIRSVLTTVHDASPACRGRNLHVSKFHGRLRLGPGRTRRIAVNVWLRPGTLSVCQGAVFRLSFRGRATRG